MRGFLVLSTAALLAAAPATASIISVSGDMLLLGNPPADVSQNELESSEKLFVFEERTLVTPSGVTVNILDPGLYDQADELVDGSLPGGLEVISNFVHFDRVPETGLPNLVGSVTFDQDVIGIIVLSDELTATDADFGAVGTVYTSGPPFADDRRGLEFAQAPILDAVTLSDDRRTVTIDAGSLLARDGVRIITNVPEPASLGVLLAGLIVSALRRRVD